MTGIQQLVGVMIDAAVRKRQVKNLDRGSKESVLSFVPIRDI